MMKSGVGFDNLLWFMGIVEDNVDPTNNGRVRVRCFGIHPPVTDETVPTEALPWAVCINGTYGTVVRVPEIAEWVFGFFADGKEGQHPMILGTIPGVNTSLPASADHPAAHPYVATSNQAIKNYGNPPLPPQLSGEDLEHTPIVRTDATSAVSALTADGESFQEPSTPLANQPGSTSVWAGSYGGSYISLSHEEGNEFITLVHESGSSVQIDPNGNIRIKTLGDRIDASDGHARERIKGRKDIVIEEGSYTLNAQNGSVIIKSKGDMVFESNSDIKFNAGGKLVMNVSDSIQMKGSNILAHAYVDNIDLFAANSLKMMSVRSLSMTSATTLNLAAPLGISLASLTNIRIASVTGLVGISALARVHLESAGAITTSSSIASHSATGAMSISGGTTLINAVTAGYMTAGAMLNIRGSVVAIDDILLLGSGAATIASIPSAISALSNIAGLVNIIQFLEGGAEPAVTPDLPDPPARAVSGGRAGVRTSSYVAGTFATDDVDDNSFI
jgi:hypothetical protein